MAKRFEATATSLQDGLDYRVDIYDARYSGTDVETLEDERQFISIPVGEADDSGKRVFKPREIQLSLIQTADASVLTNAGPTDVRVEVVRTGTSDTIYKGYIFPNRFQDSPLGPQPDTLTLQGTEGLPSLQDTSFGDLAISSNDTVEIMTTIRTILNQTYPSDLPIEIGVEWWPSSGAGSAELTTSDLPLQFAELDPANYREDRDDDSSPWWSCYQVLEDILKEQGCTIQQTFSGGSLHWHIRQRSAFQSDGTIRLWTVQPGGATTHDGLVNIRSDLSTLDDTRIKFKPNREFSQQRKRVVVTHDHTEVENFIKEGGFEDSGNGWIISGTNISAFIGDHGNWSQTPDPTGPNAATPNEHLGVMNYDSDGSVSGNIEYGFLQPTTFHIRPQLKSALRLSWSSWQAWDSSVAEGIRNHIKLGVGGTYFTEDYSELRNDVQSGKAELPVTALSASIPQGATLPIIQDAPAGLIHTAEFDVQQRAERGDTSVSGELSDDSIGGERLYHLTPTGTDSSINLHRFISEENRERWQRYTLYAPYEDSSGNRLSGNFIDLRLGLNMTQETAGFIEWLFDDVILQPVERGQVLDETVAEANDGSVGIDEETTHRLGSGPGTQNVARMYGQSRNGTSWNAFLWGDGPDTSDIYPISELHARQRLRHMSGQNQRLETTVLVEDGSPDLWGHELIRLSSLVLWNQLDGDADSKVGPDGTINGDPQPATGVSGGSGEALDFDGTGDYVSHGPSSVFTYADGDEITLSVWANVDDTSRAVYSELFGTRPDNSHPNWSIRKLSGSGQVQFYFVGDSTGTAFVWETDNEVLVNGAWVHLAVTYTFGDPGSIVMYANGSPVSGSWGTQPDEPPSAADEAFVGADVNGDFAFKGLVDEPRLYDRALSATEVGSLYHNPLSGRRDALGGKQYTISSIETRPTMGETQLNLLEHQDFGT